ncbi:MAG: hypothetical protein H6714_06585 [Myxococcales bacterium]|nr:hypothetical protein [Myxococcales bacterium]
MLSKWLAFLSTERLKTSERPTRPSGPDGAEWRKSEESRITKRVKTEADSTTPIEHASGEPTQPKYLKQAMSLRMRHSAANTFYHYHYKEK